MNTRSLSKPASFAREPAIRGYLIHKGSSIVEEEPLYVRNNY